MYISRSIGEILLVNDVSTVPSDNTCDDTMSHFNPVDASVNLDPDLLNVEMLNSRLLCPANFHPMACGSSATCELKQLLRDMENKVEEFVACSIIGMGTDVEETLSSQGTLMQPLANQANMDEGDPVGFHQNDGTQQSILRQNPLFCEECLQPFYRWIDLHSHRRKHREENLFKCRFCCMMFTHMESLNVHTTTHLQKQHLNDSKSINKSNDVCRNLPSSDDDISISRGHDNKEANSSYDNNEACEIDGVRVAAGPPRKSLQLQSIGRIDIKEFQSNESNSFNDSAHLQSSQTQNPSEAVARLPSNKNHKYFCKTVSSHCQYLKNHKRFYKCKRCNTYFEGHKSFIDHVQECLTKEKKDFNVPAPLQSFDILSHTEAMVGYSYNKWNRTFHKTVAAYCQHMKNHKRLYKCKRCKTYFQNPTSFIDHVKNHPDDKPYSQASTRRKCVNDSAKCKSLKDTSDMIIQNSQRCFECAMCLKGFKSRSRYESHILRHSGVKPFTCKVCDKSFAWPCSLDNHQRAMHTGKKLFPCKVCGKAFPQKTGHKLHMRTHTGERPYKCIVCKKSFNDSGALKKHTRIHTGERPYQCDECGKRFSRTTTLNTHLRVHAEREFQCQLCGKAFKDTPSLKRHIGRHGKPNSRIFVIARPLGTDGMGKISCDAIRKNSQV